MNIPTSKLPQVLNRENLRIIQDLTGAQLELDSTTRPSTTSSLDRCVIVHGGSLETVEFACELLQTLVTNPDADLFHLLPSNDSSTTTLEDQQQQQQQQSESSQSPPVVVTSRKSSKTASSKQQQQQIRSSNTSSKHVNSSSQQRVATTLNQFLLPKMNEELFGGSDHRAVKNEPIKPRNFAEVVARKASTGQAAATAAPATSGPTTSGLFSSSSNSSHSSSNSSLNRAPLIAATGNNGGLAKTSVDSDQLMMLMAMNSVSSYLNLS